MTIEELYEKQRQEVGSLLKVKEKIWKKMYDDQQAMVASFGSYENIPHDYKQRIQHEYQEFCREWDLENGIHYPTLKKRHAQQRMNLSEGKPVYDAPFQQRRSYGEPELNKARWKQQVSEQKEAIERQKPKSKGRGR